MFTSLTRKGLVAAISGFIIMIIATAFVVVSIMNLRASFTHLTDTSIEQIVLTKRVSVAITRAIGEARTFAYTKNQDELEQARQAISDAKTDLAALDPNAIEEYEESRQAQAEFQELYDARLVLFTRAEQLVNHLADFSDSQRNDAAKELEQIEEEFADVNQKIDEALEHETKEIAAANNWYITLVLLSISATVIVFLSFLIGSLWLLRSYIIRPIQVLSDTTTAVIAGQRDTYVSITSNDEIGSLQTNFNAMMQALKAQTTKLQEQVIVANTARMEAESTQRDLHTKLQIIEEQQATIRHMSVPILPVMHRTIVMPLIGTLDHERLQLVNDQALKAIEQTRATHLILDITGILVVDRDVADGLMKVIQATSLLGASVLLVGVRPEVAQTIVSLGIDLSDVATQSTLQSGIQAVQRRMFLAEHGVTTS